MFQPKAVEEAVAEVVEDLLLLDTRAAQEAHTQDLNQLLIPILMDPVIAITVITAMAVIIITTATTIIHQP
jgi:hypothetical protein